MAAPQPSPQSAVPNHRDESKGRLGIIGAVKTPLGFFALVVLVTELILGGLATKAAGTDFTMLVGGMLLVLITMVVVVGLGDLKGKSTPKPASRRADQAPSLNVDSQSKSPEVFDKRLDDRLRQIRQNVQLAAKRNNAVLSEEISNEVNNLVIQSVEWSRGELHTAVQRYNSVLLTLYEHARGSIFSTTIRDYLSVWPDDLMERMIIASENARTKSVTRIFVFGKREEVDERAIQILRRFARCTKIRSLVYIDNEDFHFNFQPDISRDFVVIDNGEEIGVTVSYSPGSLSAVWYFGDEDRKESFEKTCAGLTKGSVPAEEILKWWDKGPDATQPEDQQAAN